MHYAATRAGDVNLYRTIAAVLREEIEDGVLRPGDRLPSEEALRSQYAVSRGTVRQALDALERDGLIERQVGRGTFVRALGARAPRKVRVSADWREAAALAAETTRVVRQGTAPPAALVEAIFGSSEPIHFSIHVRHRSPPLGVKRHLRADLGDCARRVLSAGDFAAALEAEVKQPVVIGRFWADAVLAEPRFALLLKVTAGSALHSLWWVYEVQGVPVACVQMLLPGDAFSLSVVGDAP